MNIGKLVRTIATATVLGAAALSTTGCVKIYTREKPDYSELRRIEGQPGYRTDFWQRKCPDYVPPQYCKPRR